MKNILIISFLLSIFSGFAQEQKGKKFLLGVNYSLTYDNDLHNRPLSASLNYKIKQWENIDLEVGFRTMYFKSKIPQNFSDKWAFNPTIGSSYSFSNKKLNVFLSGGYYFDSYTFEVEEILSIENQYSGDLKTNGFTIAPGLRYFISPSFFLESNVILVSAKTKNISDLSESNTSVFFNLGVGVAF